MSVQELEEELFESAFAGNLQDVDNILQEVRELSVAVNLNYALRCAVQQGHLEVVGLLLENGADPNDRYDILGFAAREGYLNILKILVEYGTVEKSINWTLDLAAENGHIDVVKFLVEKGANINEAFYTACYSGVIDVVEYFVEKGANDNAIRTEQGWDASMDSETAKFLKSLP